MIVWVGFNLDPQAEKPQKSVEKIVAKISPFLENIAKMAKTGMNMSEVMSDNKSSVSKTEKNISPFYKQLNQGLFKELTGGKQERFIKKSEATLKIKDLVAYGKMSKVIGDN